MMWNVIVPAAAAIVVAVIEAIAAHERSETKKQHEKTEKRAALREEESRLAMKMMDATLQLSMVTANALTGGHNNGNVATARHAADEAQAEYIKFLQRVTAKEVSKV